MAPHARSTLLACPRFTRGRGTAQPAACSFEQHMHAQHSLTRSDVPLSLRARQPLPNPFPLPAPYLSVRCHAHSPPLIYNKSHLPWSDPSVCTDRFRRGPRLRAALGPHLQNEPHDAHLQFLCSYCFLFMHLLSAHVVFVPPFWPCLFPQLSTTPWLTLSVPQVPAVAPLTHSFPVVPSLCNCSLKTACKACPLTPANVAACACMHAVCQGRVPVPRVGPVCTW